MFSGSYGWESTEQNGRGSAWRIGLYFAVIPESFGTSPSRAKYVVVVVGNFARVDERNAPLSTGALGYRVCGVTGPGSYANYSP